MGRFLFAVIALLVGSASAGDFVSNRSSTPYTDKTQGAVCPYAVTDPTKCWTYQNANALKGAVLDLRDSVSRFPVMAFGAKCDSDGTRGNGTDDTAAIRAAIAGACAVDAANNYNVWDPTGRGGTVEFPSGVCRVTDTIAIPKCYNIAMVGQGMRASNVMCDLGDVNKDCLTVGNGGGEATRFQLRDMSWFGPDYTSVRDIAFLNNPTWSGMERVTLWSAARYGLRIGGTIQFIAHDLWTFRNGVGGLVMSQAYEDEHGVFPTTPTFYNLYSLDNGYFGVWLKRVSAASFYQPIIEFNGWAGKPPQGYGGTAGRNHQPLPGTIITDPEDVSWGLKVGDRKNAQSSIRTSYSEVDVHGGYFEGNLGWDVVCGDIENEANVTAQFVQPVVSGTVSVAVDQTYWTAVGRVVYVDGGGRYTVSSIPDSTHVVLTNLGYTGNAAPAATVPAGGKARSRADNNGRTGVSRCNFYGGKSLTWSQLKAVGFGFVYANNSRVFAAGMELLDYLNWGIANTTASFVMPVVGADATVAVDDSSVLTANRLVYVHGAGYMTVMSITDPTHVVLRNVGRRDNEFPYSTIQSGVRINYGNLNYSVDGASALTVFGVTHQDARSIPVYRTKPHINQHTKVYHQGFANTDQFEFLGRPGAQRLGIPSSYGTDYAGKKLFMVPYFTEGNLSPPPFDQPYNPYEVGDTALNATPVPGTPIGWMCTTKPCATAGDWSAMPDLGVRYFPLEGLLTYAQMPAIPASPITAYRTGQPAVGETFGKWALAVRPDLPYALDVPADCAGMVAKADTNPTSPATVSLKKNGVSFGSVTFAVDGTPSVSCPTSTQVLPGDVVSFTSDSDAGLGGVLVSLSAAQVPLQPRFVDGGNANLLSQDANPGLEYEWSETWQSWLCTLGSNKCWGGVGYPDAQFIGELVSGLLAPDWSSGIEHFTALNSYHLLNANANVSPNTTYTASWFFKNNGGTSAQYMIDDITNEPTTYGTITGNVSYASELAGFWKRKSVTFTTGATTTRVRIAVLHNSGANVNIYIWKPKLEVGTSATPAWP